MVRLEQQSGAIPCQELVLGNQWREMENMKAQFVAVNGIRKVACVVCNITYTVWYNSIRMYLFINVWITVWSSTKP